MLTSARWKSAASKYLGFRTSVAELLGVLHQVGGEEDGLAGARRVDNAHHMLRREHGGCIQVDDFLLGLYQIHGGGGGAVLGMAIHRIYQVLVEKILRSKFEILGVAALPGRRPQVAGGGFAFSGIELR